MEENMRVNWREDDKWEDLYIEGWMMMTKMIYQRWTLKDGSRRKWKENGQL